jgi:hypothetical protein
MTRVQQESTLDSQNRVIRRSAQTIRAIIALTALVVALVSPRAQSAAATPGVLPWSQPAPVATGLANAARPVLAFTSNGAAHVIWESEGELYYAARPRAGDWSAAERVATGTAPALLADRDGTLHLVFTDYFMGNHEIFYAYRQGGIWSLPTAVSRTTGYSTEPALALTAGGALYAAWMDNTPGYWTIYLGAWDGSVWSSRPVPNARGQIPALTVGADGTISLAWQDRFPPDQPSTTKLDIFLTDFSEGRWSLPSNISDRPDVDSYGVSMATTPDRNVHLTWIEGSNQVRYCFGQGNGWSLPQTVATAATVARGAIILAERGGWLDIAWDEREIVRAAGGLVGAAAWPKAEIVAIPIASLKDVTLAANWDGDLALGWVQTTDPKDAGIYTVGRGAAFPWRRWLPVSLHQ